MLCVICGLPTDDACVPLCDFHLPVAALAYEVETAERSDWPFHVVSHAEMACGEMVSRRQGAWHDQVAEIVANR